MSLRVSTSSPLISACSGLMYSGVPTICAKLREQRLLGQLLAGRLGDAEVDHLGHRHAVVQRDQDVRRLEVAVDDPLLMRVLDRLADRDEQLQPLARSSGWFWSQYSVIGTPAHQLHHEVRPAGVGRAGVEDLGDVRDGPSSPAPAARPRSGRSTCRVSMPGLMTFSATLRRTGSRLLGHEDDADAAFADLLQQLVAADDRADLLAAADRRSTRMPIAPSPASPGTGRGSASASPGASATYSSTDGARRGGSGDEVVGQLGEQSRRRSVSPHRLLVAVEFAHGRNSVSPPGISARISFSRLQART